MPERVTLGRGHGIGFRGTLNSLPAFCWFLDDEQRQLPRGFADKSFNFAHEFGWHANRNGGLVVFQRPRRFWGSTVCMLES